MRGQDRFGTPSSYTLGFPKDEQETLMKKLGFPDTPDFLPVASQHSTTEQQHAFPDSNTALAAIKPKDEMGAGARSPMHQKTPHPALHKKPAVPLTGCVFAKSCNLPDGVINHSNPSGFVPLEKLANYGMWAVLGTDAALTVEGIPLKLLGSSATQSVIAQRLGGSLALGLPTGSAAADATAGTVALLMPNTQPASDSAIYKQEQYAQLEAGRTRVRINVTTLPDGSVRAYGFYTGGKQDWEFVPVIKATQEGEKFVAEIGNGFRLIWTPADLPGIPSLEGASLQPTIWVYPSTEQAEKVLVNPEHPPQYQDAIIWFPSNAGLEPIYLVLNQA